MKSLAVVIFTMFGLFFSQATYSNPSNISVTVDGITYQCSGNGVTCYERVEELRWQLDACDTSESMSYCVNKIWPNWKTNNSQCLTEGSAVCVEVCSKSESFSYCFERCK